MSRKVDPEAQRLTMERFMRAGIEAIAEKGIDNVTVQYVSEKAKSSRPTFYSYFGDINGFLAETWIFKAPMWLADISNPLVSPSKLSKQDLRSVNSQIESILRDAVLKRKGASKERLEAS